MPLATDQILTEVHSSPEGDTHYPEFDESEWSEIRRESHLEHVPPYEIRWLASYAPDGPMVARVELRIFVEPQQGATYDQLLRIARASEDLGFDAFFRSDHFLGMGTDRAARPHRRVADPGRSGARDQHHPARHDDDLGDLPAPGAAGDPGRPGRPHERRPGRVRARCRVVRGRAHGLRHPVPRHPRALRHPRGAAGHHHRAVGDPSRRAVLARRQALHADRLTGAAQDRAEAPAPGPRGRQGHPSDAGAGRRVRRRVQPALRLDRRDHARCSTGRAPPASGSAATPTTWCTPTPCVCAAGSTTPTYAAGPSAGNREIDGLRENGLVGTPAEVVDQIGRFAEAGTQRLYLQTLDVVDLDHLELVAHEVMRQL